MFLKFIGQHLVFLHRLLGINSGNTAIVIFVVRKYSAIRRTPISVLTYNMNTDFSRKNRVPYNQETTVNN